MNVLDACAAPGGKTAYLSALMMNTGHITALEIHEHRVELMKSTFTRLNVPNAKVIQADASKDVADFHKQFDIVLTDVPCSGLGVLSKPDIKFQRTEDEVVSLTKLQYEILSACSNYVTDGGTLVYSTCTLSKRENEDIVYKFLENHGDFSPCDSESEQNALTQRIKDGMLTILPHLDNADGFFITKMKRKTP
jgi:16S rRNA (cytosine967-C5)-methyltransferase